MCLDEYVFSISKRNFREKALSLLYRHLKDIREFYTTTSGKTYTKRCQL